MPEPAIVREVGLRDGLQSISTVMSTATKRAWLTAEYAAGVRHFEATSFVPARLLPQLADAEQVIAHASALPGAEVAALVPNVKGAVRALQTDVGTLVFVISASEAHNLANVRQSVAESIKQFGEVVALVRAEQRGRRVVGAISTAFGCSIAGSVSATFVIALAVALAEAGADEITLADTVGFAAPPDVRTLFRRVGAELPTVLLSAHFHDTRGLGLANVCAAIEGDVRTFDASLGGLGGCPHAPGASGNIVIEDLVFLLDRMGFDTGIDLDRLVGVRALLEEALPDPLYGTFARAGWPTGASGTTSMEMTTSC